MTAPPRDVWRAVRVVAFERGWYAADLDTDGQDIDHGDVAELRLTLRRQRPEPGLGRDDPA